MPISHRVNAKNWEPDDLEILLHRKDGSIAGKFLHEFGDVSFSSVLMGEGDITLSGPVEMFPRVLRGRNGWLDNMAFWTARMGGADVETGFFTEKTTTRSLGADVILVKGLSMNALADRILHIPQNKEVEGYGGDLPTIMMYVCQNNANNSRVNHRTYISDRNYTTYWPPYTSTANAKKYTLFYGKQSLLKTLQDIASVENSDWTFNFSMGSEYVNNPDHFEIGVTFRESQKADTAFSFSVDGAGIENWAQSHKPPEWSAGLVSGKIDDPWMWVRDGGLLNGIRSWGIPAREKSISTFSEDVPQNEWVHAVIGELHADSNRQLEDVVIDLIGPQHFNWGWDYKLGDYLSVQEPGVFSAVGRFVRGEASVVGGKLSIKNVISV